MVKTHLRTPYNYDRSVASEVTAFNSNKPSLTRQEFKSECDINTIIQRFGLDYQQPGNIRLPTFGDFTGVDDYHSAINQIALANESFDQLSAQVRLRFNNDPGAFVEFCSDESNKPELEKLGLIIKPEPVLITPVSPVPTGEQLPKADSLPPA